HSCVHMHWLLVRLLRLYPDLEGTAQIRSTLAAHFSSANVAREVAYLAQPNRASFERPYGWAWLMKLACELSQWDDDDARAWSSSLAPLVSVFVARYLAWLPKAAHPVRHGVHSNSAFGLLFALEYARAQRNTELESALVQRARSWFDRDADYPAAWEPSGEDFLSPALIEAELMRHVHAPSDYAAWLQRFLPRLAQGEPAALFAA